MKLNEKYDQIIRDIEYAVVVNNRELSAMEQLTYVANRSGYYGAELRDFTAAFLFITGMRPLEYIKRRRLMHSYKTLMEQEHFDVSEVYVIAGYDNQNSFGKKFRTEFGISAKEAWKKKDFLKYEEPLFWSSLAGVELHMKDLEDQAESDPTIFGFDMQTYDKFVEFQNLCATYGVRKEQGEVAYEIADKYSLTLDKAFDYVSNIPYVTTEMFIKNGYEYYFGEPDEGEEPLTAAEFNPKAYYLDMVDDANMIYCCTKCGLSREEAIDALDRLDIAFYSYEPQNCSPAFLYACAHSDSSPEFLASATEYYLKESRGEVDYERFEKYLEYVDSYEPFDEAYDGALMYMTESDIDEMLANPDVYYRSDEDDPVEMMLDQMAVRRGER